MVIAKGKTSRVGGKTGKPLHELHTLSWTTSFHGCTIPQPVFKSQRVPTDAAWTPERRTNGCLATMTRVSRTVSRILKLCGNCFMAQVPESTKSFIQPALLKNPSHKTSRPSSKPLVRAPHRFFVGRVSTKVCPRAVFPSCSCPIHSGCAYSKPRFTLACEKSSVC